MAIGPAPAAGVGEGGKQPAHTFWDEDDDDTHEATQNQSPHLTPLAAQLLHHEDAEKAGRHLNGSKYQLRQVDVQAKVSHLEAEAIVPQTVHKPVRHPRVPVTAWCATRSHPKREPALVSVTRGDTGTAGERAPSPRAAVPPLG